jgi:UDP-N-acetyl-D-galactosamine dehydrogenase
LRNSKVIDVVHELQSYGVDVDVVDPHAQPEEVEHEYQLAMSSWSDLKDQSTPNTNKYAAVILAVSHKEFLETDVRQFMLPEAVLYDVKAVLPQTWVDGRL